MADEDKTLIFFETSPKRLVGVVALFADKKYNKALANGDADKSTKWAIVRGHMDAVSLLLKELVP